MARGYCRATKLGHQQSFYTVTYNGKVVNSGANKEVLLQWMRMRGYWNTNTNLPNQGFGLNETMGMDVGRVGSKGTNPNDKI